MKKILVSVWCLMAVVLISVSCNKKTEETAATEKKEAANAFAGTTWMASHTRIDTLADTTYIFTSDAVIKFLDAENGVMYSDQRVFVNSKPELADDPLRTIFTYSIQGDNGKMVLDFGKEDTLHRYPRYIENTFKFDKEQNTITTYAPNAKELEVYFEVE